MSILDANGLTIDTLPEIVTQLEDGNKLIYGNDIIIDSNSPDGQLINLYAQSKRDVLELLNQVYSGFSLNNAIGTVLDERVSLLSIQRQGATFTQQQVQITVSGALTLQGLDSFANDLNGIGYTVADNTGTQFILLDTINIAVAGTYNLTFRAKDLGSITTIPNTITNPITTVLGVTAINNPTGVLVVGLNGELDSVLRIRAKQSPANKSTGYINGLEGSLKNVSGVTDVKVFENFTTLPDIYGTPAHTIWAICEGGANTDIANTIYTNKNGGCGLRGTVIVDILQDNGSIFTAKFDRPQSVSLWIRFEIKQTLVGQGFDQPAIKQYLVDNLKFIIGQSAETATVTTLTQEAINATGGGGVPLNVEISNDGLSYVDFLATSTPDKKWIVDSLRIDIVLL